MSHLVIMISMDYLSFNPYSNGIYSMSTYTRNEVGELYMF